MPPALIGAKAFCRTCSKMDGQLRTRHMTQEKRETPLPKAQSGAIVDLAIRLGLLGLLGYWSFTLIAPFLTIALWSAILTAALYPLFDRLAQHFGRRLAATLITLLCLLIVVGPVTWLGFGLVGGIVVGLTSVGSGSLIIIALMALYPTLKASELVGTDLVQAVPLVASAALGHLLFGDFQLTLTTSLLAGAIPGVWIGAHLSARASGGLVRRALAFVLLASALKLLNVSTVHTGIVLAAVLVFAPLAWMMIRRRHGFPTFAWTPHSGQASREIVSDIAKGPSRMDGPFQ